MERQIHDAVKKLNKEVALYAIGSQMQSLLEKYQATPEVTAYLKAVENDILDNLTQFARRGGRSPTAAALCDAMDERGTLQEI